MTTKHYGLVTAKIDDQDHKIALSFSDRGKQPLDRSHPQRCLSWALAALAELTDQGYVITIPEG